MPRARRPILILVIAVLLAALGVGIAYRLRPAGPGRPAISRVILLSIDTLRADALPFHGNPRVKAPALSRLAREAIFFERAWATSPWTRPSVVSLLTGLSPGVHGATSESLEVESVIPESVPTLAESMGAAGYRTAAIGFNPFLANSGNVRRGFRDFWFFPRPEGDGRPTARGEPTEDSEALVAGASLAAVNREIDDRNSTAVLTRLAHLWIREHRGEDFFLWLHYYDPHLPYMPPEERYDAGPGNARPADRPYAEWLEYVAGGVGHYLALDRQRRQGKLDAKGAARLAEIHAVITGRADTLRALYEAEVEHVDAAIGQVVRLLKELGLYEGTLIVVTSDHGEEFLEHGGLEHGHTLYEEVVRVPLLIKPPGPPAPTVVRDRVSNQSIFPTLLDLCDVPRPALQDEAPSLTALWKAGRGGERPPYIAASSILYGEPGTTLIFGDYKYVVRPQSGSEELFDLAADPAEASPLGADAAERLQKARDFYRNWDRRRIALRKAVWTRGMRRSEQDEKTRKLLESLGYLK